MTSSLVTPTLVALAVLIGTVGQFLLKAGMARTGRVESVAQAVSPTYLLNAFSHWQVPIAIVFYALGAILWMAVLSRERVSYAYPFLGLTYILVMLGGVLLFGETPRPMGVAGTMLIALGVVMVARAG
ncbi:MAG: hypothetical protein CVT60_01335 [Actinobacteria bacterium HGW-Actinobacteria-10]|jgi:multidrug transporter EmrE-like cation transporter|nr:MAG: hypothetical protein CVT60_01335 [Actinobacteria bacterium HGW-Actinobacteria-10]